MALQQLLCWFCVAVILLCKGGDSQQPACGSAVENTGSWPWLVTIKVNGQFRCGGSLITDQWVLTAASCVSSNDTNNTVVYLGRRSLLYINLIDLNRTLEAINCHPKYNSSTYENDICLLKLSAHVPFSDDLHPICLASGNSTFSNGTSSWITGFGFESKASSFPKILQEVNASIVGRNECQCNYKSEKVITENMICAELQTGGKDSCWWDGGEPLMIKNGSVWVQSGVMTLHGSCGSPLKPEISTRVSQYQMWINNTVTGMRPGFVTFTSPDDVSDLKFTCSGANLIHFTSLWVPVALLHVFVGSS